MAKVQANKPHKRQLVVANSLGLHARVAARIAETVQKYDCQVVLKKDGAVADGGSILSILTLDAPVGSSLHLEAHGSQACQALDELVGLFESRFGEE